MKPLAPRRDTHWIVQPLVDAGLEPEEIRLLMIRLGFEAVVAGPSPLGMLDLVGDRPPPVRAAWLETLERITTLPAAGA